MAAGDYPDFYRTLVAEKSIRSRRPLHPRISIWDPFEARLQQSDVVILGSLNEGTWPQAADPGPWLNRPMREALGLPAPEERIGDCRTRSSLAARRAASLSHARRQGRWRADGALALAAAPAGAAQAVSGCELKAEQPWLAWAQARNRWPARCTRARARAPPAACSQRPRELSVTTIENWIANPYAVFAERILGLEALPAARPPARRGAARPDRARSARPLCHAFRKIARGHHAELVAIAEAVLAELTGKPRVAAFWAPRFARFAAWFADTEPRGATA